MLRSLLLGRWIRDTRGGHLAEYLIVLGAVAIVALAGVRAFGKQLRATADGQAACVASLDGSCTGKDGALPTGRAQLRAEGGDGGPVAKPGVAEAAKAATAAAAPAPETGPVGPPLPGEKAKTPPKKGEPRKDVVDEIYKALTDQTLTLEQINGGKKKGTFTDEEFGDAYGRWVNDVMKEHRPKFEAAERKRRQEEHDRINEEHRKKHFEEQMAIVRASVEEMRARDELRKLNDELAWELSKAAVDVAGVADPTPISDGVSAAMSISDGDLLGAGLSLVSMVPYAGDALGKTAKGAKLAKKLNDLKDAVKAVSKRLVAAEEATARAMKKAKGATDPPKVPAKVPSGGGGGPPPKKPTGGGGDPPGGGGPPKKGGGDDAGPSKGPDDGGGGKPPKRETPKRPRADKDELTDVGRNKPSPLTESELKKMNVWVERRNYFLDKWHGKDLDGVDDATKKLVQDTKADHAIRDHMTPDDIAGKMKEQRGVEIKKGDKVMDHVGEVENARDAVKKNIQAIQGRLKELADSGDTASKNHQILVEKLKDLQHILDMTK